MMLKFQKTKTKNQVQQVKDELFVLFWKMRTIITIRKNQVISQVNEA